MAGMTPTGFEPKTTEDLTTDLGSGLRGVFGAAITLIAQSIFGQMVGIIADRLAQLWQLGLAIYAGSTREAASGIQLDHIGALTGTPRKPASYTHVQLTCGGVNGTIITAGSKATIPGVGTQFTNDAPGTIAGGVVVIDFRAVVTGPFAAPAGTVVQIDTPIAGWATVTNVADENILGADIEKDAAYRVRQVQELRAIGASTVAAIRAKVGAIVNVLDVFVFDNSSDTTDGEGVPGHAFETVVSGGTDAAVASSIALNKPVGIGTTGNTTIATTDANGFAVNTKFSRPTVLDIYIVTTVTVDAAKFPSNGAALVKQALVDYEVNYHLGSEVRSSALVPSIFSIPGVLELPLPFIGTAAAPVTSATISVNNRQKADLDTGRITVNVVPIIP